MLGIPLLLAASLQFQYPSSQCFLCVSLCVHMAIYSLHASLSASYKDNSYIGLRSHPTPVWRHLNFNYICNNLFPNEVTFWDTGNRTYPSRDTIQPTTDGNILQVDLHIDWILIKISDESPIEINKLTLKFIWKMTQTSKNNLEKEKIKSEDLNFHDYKLTRLQ